MTVTHKYIVVVVLLCFICCAGQRRLNISEYYHGPVFTFSTINMERTAAHSDYPDANAVFLLREAKYQLKEISTFSEHVVLKVLKESGKRYADIKIPFWRECEVLDLKARTIKPNGVVINLNEDDIYEVTDFPEFIMYADRKAKVFTFPSVDTGCVLEYIYTMAYAGPYVPPWYFQASEPVRVAKFTYDVPPFVDFKYVVSSLEGYEIEQEIKDSGRSSVGVFVGRDLPPLIPEPLTSPKNDITSWIQMAWSSFHHFFFGEISSGQESWYQMGRTYTTWVDSMVKVTKAIEDRVEEITLGCENDEQRIRAIHSFIQGNCRYVAVEIAGHRILPNPSTQVLLNQYGDCKDLAGLMISMLRAAGIDAYTVLVRTRNAGRLVKSLSTFGQIDHVVVAVPLKHFSDEKVVSQALLYGELEFSKDDDYVIIDPTVPTQAIGFLHAGIQGRDAVLCAGMDSKLTLLPSADYNYNSMSSRILFRMDDKEYHGNIEIQVTGEEALWLRHLIVNSNRSQMRDYLQNFMSGFPLRTSIDTFSLQGVDQFNTALQVNIQFAKYGSLQTSKDQLFVPVFFTALPQFRALYDCHERIHNVEFDFPYKRSDMFRLLIPDGFKVVSLPERENVKNDWCEYTCASYLCGDTVVVNRNILVKECLIPKQYFAEIKYFAAKVLDSGQKLVVLAKK